MPTQLAPGLQFQDVTRYVNIQELRPLFSMRTPVTTASAATTRLAALFRPATCTFHPQRQDARGITNPTAPSIIAPPSAIALLCVAREGVQGGLHVFDKPHTPSILREPYPGHLLLYDPTLLTHSTTQLVLPPNTYYPHQDILIIHCTFSPDIAK